MASPLIFLLAGEPSGDALGADLMRALKHKTDEHVRFVGVGGPAMEAEGMTSLFPMSELSVMGLVEVLPRLRTLLDRIRETVQAVRDLEPDVVVTIDAQDFSYRVARTLAPAPCPVVHYVAPTVWAWKPRRAKKVAAVVDRLLLLFPFENRWWDAVGQDNVFVGHPIADLQMVVPSTEAVKTGPRLALLPGSRAGEVRRHLPIFRLVVERLLESHPRLEVVLPTVENVADLVRDGLRDWPVGVHVHLGSPEERRALLATADAALAVSGTVALDLAAAGVPHVIAYKANPLTAAIVRRMLTIRYVSLVNLIADAPVTPELLQEWCTVDSLVREVARLLDDPEAADRQRQGMSSVIASLRPEGVSPSNRAASAVLDIMQDASQGAV